MHGRLYKIIDHLYYTNQKGLITWKRTLFRDGKAYLKNMLATHLANLPKILAFHSANQKDGGTGATILQLNVTNKGNL